MATDARAARAETFVDRRVRYKIDLGDRLVVIEDVPARVCEQTGDQFFAPETADRIWQIVHGGKQPARIMQAEVYDFH
jgi:YgiT-type zinc finger domain-containing protein